MNAVRKSRKVLAGILVLVLVGLGLALAWPALSDLLYQVTGEENLAGQIRGGLEYAGNLMRPQPETADDVAVQHVGMSPFGVNTFLNQEVEPEKRERSVRMIAEAGFRWIRQEFPWEDIEIHGKGDYEDRRHEPHRSAWDKYDQIVDLAGQVGLDIIARLSNPPAWSRKDPEMGDFAPPDDLADYADFVRAVVTRYRGQVRIYQIWNEPNIYPEWGNRPVDPEDYTELLRVGYTAVKDVCPECVVVSGALAQTIPLGPRDLNDFVFLQRMYDAGAGAYFDVLAIQGYGLWSGPTDRRMRARVLNFSRPLYLREIMVENGDAHKPIWITEMNWNAPPPDLPDKRFGLVTPEQQARYAVEAFQRAQAEWPWLGVVNVWFFKRATDTERDQAMYYFRLVEPDFTPLPVYEAVKEHANQTQPLYRGLHQEDHYALGYTGAWEEVASPEASLGRYQRAAVPGARLEFAFAGSSLTLQPGPGGGEIEVQVDDGPPTRWTLEDGPLRLASDWWGGTHHVALIALSDRVAVDAFLVRAPDWPLRVTNACLALLALGLLVGLVWRRRVA
jgi:hypothetical protein